ncbi:SAF domain-containing protein [Helcobacillus massiliensis]|uniref:SAF domain-containing protein n=1 Tax=Helcobacillus massiliensis TaxID=521392 RepID=A0A839QNE5_9MICO|nr:SAF domain-containing protein [Helcobacillus massiliensis]MBB3021993.1 hypothetical protein [Helcobacillus massiliensis]
MDNLDQTRRSGPGRFQRPAPGGHQVSIRTPFIHNRPTMVMLGLAWTNSPVTVDPGFVMSIFSRRPSAAQNRDSEGAEQTRSPDPVGPAVLAPGRAPVRAMRLRRPRARDPRLLTGIALVLISVLAGAGILTAATRTTTVLVATTDIAEGQKIDPSAFRQVEVSLGDSSSSYAVSADQIPAGALAATRIEQGELLPVSAIGQSEESTLRPIAVPIESGAAAGLQSGDVVEVWTAASAKEGAEASTKGAHMLVDRAQVRSVSSGSSLSMQKATVEVLVPADSVAEVLEAIDRDDSMFAIEVLGGTEVG